MARFPNFRPLKKIQERQLQLRGRLWPDLDTSLLWSRHSNDGFSTIPSAMPLIMSIMDDMSKGSPVSSTYLDLWTRVYDEGFVTLAKPREMAFHAGFSTQRAERTWRQKLDTLAALKFIDLKSGPSGPASYALLWNPYRVIARHQEDKTPGLREDKFNALVARALELGDKTFAPVEVAPPQPAPFQAFGLPQAPIPFPTSAPTITAAPPAMPQSIPPSAALPQTSAPTYIATLSARAVREGGTEDS